MRYVSDNVISFSIFIKNRKDSIRVSFSPLSTGGSSFSTKSEAVMEALENSRMYGKIYFRAPECLNETIGVKKPSRASAKAKKKLVTEVGSWQDAVEYLVANCQSKAGNLLTPDAILSEAESNNIEFPNLG